MVNMTDVKTSKLSDELQWRGFVNQTTFTDITELDKGPITFYFGVDPSADSMTIGNLAAAMMVRHFIDHGHKAYLLVGGATGMIGDPDGRKDERNLKTAEEIAHNKAAIAQQYKQVFDGQSFDIVDNYDWFKDINYLDFLREVGKNVPMSQMLGREFVESRLQAGGAGISYAEFSYSLIQGFDFVHLNRQHGVTLQVCGADQWGNSLAGVDLLRRLDGKEAHVYSVPLVINKATGRKFGKSEGGAVWLDEDKTSVYSFYQFWLNVDDEGVIDYLKIFSLLSQSEIQQLELEAKTNPGQRSAQKALAYAVTSLVHGVDRAENARNVSQVLFGGREFANLLDAEIDMLSKEIPVAHSSDLMHALTSTGVAKSNGEARRLIEAGSVSVNNQKATESINLPAKCLIKKGKNSFILVQ